MKLYSHYKSGFLIYEGGIYDQPLWYVDAMKLIAGEVAENERERFESEKQRRGLR